MTHMPINNMDFFLKGQDKDGAVTLFDKYSDMTLLGYNTIQFISTKRHITALQNTYNESNVVPQ